MNIIHIVYRDLNASSTELSSTQLRLVDLMAQLVEQCNGIAEVRVRVPVQAFLAAAKEALKIARFIHIDCPSDIQWSQRSRVIRAGDLKSVLTTS